MDSYNKVVALGIDPQTAARLYGLDFGGDALAPGVEALS